MEATRARSRIIAVLLAAAAGAAGGCGSSPPGEQGGIDAGPDDTGSQADVGSQDLGSQIDAGPPPTPAGVVAAGVRWFGRVDTTDPTKPRFSWSGTGFVAQFMGTSLTMQLTVTGAAQIFKTVVDGAPQPTFTASVGQRMYPLAMGLAAGVVHTVETYRQTEGGQGESQLTALVVGDGALMDPPAGPGRLIEIIGDSISAGYGTLGASTDTECFTTESAWDTYGAIAARALNAEASIIAASGRGVIRNYAVGDTTGTLPMIYTRTLTNASTLWDFHIQPQAVIINLGTNDISNGKGDPGMPFRDTYRMLLETVRSKYPSAFIVGIIAPLLSASEAAVIGGHIQAAVDARVAAGDTKVEYFNKIPPQTQDKFACQAHPNPAENTMMAGQLEAELRAKLGW